MPAPSVRSCALVLVATLATTQPARAVGRAPTSPPALAAPPPEPTRPALVDLRPPPRPFTVYQLAWHVDVPLIITGAALSLAALSAAAAPKQPCGTLGNPDPCPGFFVGGFDEWAVGPRAHAADVASDVTRALAFSAPLVLGGYSLFDLRPRARDGAAGIAADMLVVGEALAITAGLTGLLKDAVGRRRPWAYDRGDPELPRDDFRSFPSGHASAAFAAVSAACVTFVRRHEPRPLLAVAACGPGYALAGGTAFLRVEAGAHFPSDVLVGAVIGTVVGVGVPLLHADPRNGGVRLGVVPVPGGMAFALQGFR